MLAQLVQHRFGGQASVFGIWVQVPGTALCKYFAVCPGGEGAVLKTVGPKGLAGSNPVYGVSSLL